MMKNAYVVSVITKINMVILTFIGSVLVNRYLGPTLKGEYFYLMNYVGIISLIMTLSITKALPFYLKKYGAAIEQQFINFVYLQTGMYIIIMLTVYFITNDKFVFLILFFSIVSQFYQQISFIAIIKNINRKNVLSLVDLVIYILILLVLFFIRSNEKLLLVYYAYAIKLFVSVFIYVISFKIYPNNRGIDIPKFKEIMIFSLFPTISSLLITFNYKIDIIILKNFVSFSQIGLYSLAVTLASMLWILPDAFKDVLFNKTAKNDSIKDIVFSIKFNMYFSIVIVILFWVFGRNFIEFFYGAEFIDASIVTTLMFIGNIPMIFFKMINTLYISKGKQKVAMFMLSISVALNIASNFILIPMFGIKGAAFASVLSYSLCGFVFLYYFIKEYKLRFKDIIVFSSEEIRKINTLLRRAS